ncbi:Spo0E family sporulation regulatory protein-aspartic acid phosphatase [Clostridium swellfunianum]
MEEKIESTRSILCELVAEENAQLCDGKILEISMVLDNLIALFYEESSNV